MTTRTNKYYDVEIFDKALNTWRPMLCATAVSRQYANGFVHGMLQYYPSDDLRIVCYTFDLGHRVVIEEFKGNGKVNLN